MSNLQKAIKIVNKRLPKSYLVPIKTYKTIYSLLKAYCRMDNRDYKDRVEWYTKYRTNPKTNTYMKTKYWREKEDYSCLKRNHRKKGFDISAIAYNPILIAENSSRRKNGYRISLFNYTRIRTSLVR